MTTELCQKTGTTGILLLLKGAIRWDEPAFLEVGEVQVDLSGGEAVKTAVVLDTGYVASLDCALSANHTLLCKFTVSLSQYSRPTFKNPWGKRLTASRLWMRQ